MAGDGVARGPVQQQGLDQRRQQDQGQQDEGHPERLVGARAQAHGRPQGRAEPHEQGGDRDAEARAELLQRRISVLACVMRAGSTSAKATLL